MLAQAMQQEAAQLPAAYHRVARSGTPDEHLRNLRSEEETAGVIDAAMNGDLSAFNCLVISFQDSLYWWVFSLVNDEALAEDITQATFIKAYEKLPLFRGGSFKAWLFMIARNRSFDELRRVKRHPALRLDAPQDEPDERELLAVLPNHEPQPEEALIESERANLVTRQLALLPEPFQHVLRLVDMEGMEYQEAAEVLGLPLGTIKSQLFRGRLKLRDLLVQNGIV
jgi:RNA polymerase sigma-70 factor (ECF subfamily)